MNTFSKILLSDDEQQLVSNTGWILTKRKILDKVCDLLGQVSEYQKAVIENERNWLPDVAILSTPKIAKGENYLQLPYMLLDYPRCFHHENIFAVRTMFWWGNFFSITLHLAGIYKTMFQQKITDNIEKVKQDIFIGIHENQWQHHFEADNYLDIHLLSKEELEKRILEKPFIKLAIKFPLQPWDTIPWQLNTSFTEMITMLKD
jgi:hypothetical protein